MDPISVLTYYKFKDQPVTFVPRSKIGNGPVVLVHPFVAVYEGYLKNLGNFFRNYQGSLSILSEKDEFKGLGNIAKSLGMKVIIWKRRDNLVKAIKEADVLYSALPLSEETKGLIGENEFKTMKKGSYFVTTSHNKIYDHDALLNALDSNLVGAAIDLEGIDVGDYKAEAYLKFKSHPKILLTPHIAYKTDYALMRGNDIMIDNIEAFVNGRPQNIVN